MYCTQWMITPNFTTCAASEKECTDGFLNSLRTGNHRSGRLFPLLGRHRRTIDEQWIFPSLRFTCQGRLTKWIFRAAYPQSASPQCRINIGTWRLDRSSSNTIYRRMSTTERLRRITNDGPIFTYELATAVRVEPDDIVGVELESCLASGGFSNILSLDDNRTDSISPRHRQFEIDSTFRVIHLVPFLQPVIGKIHVIKFNNAHRLIYTCLFVKKMGW